MHIRNFCMRVLYAKRRLTAKNLNPLLSTVSRRLQRFPVRINSQILERLHYLQWRIQRVRWGQPPPFPNRLSILSEYCLFPYKRHIVRWVHLRLMTTALIHCVPPCRIFGSATDCLYTKPDPNRNATPNRNFNRSRICVWNPRS